MFLSLLRSTFHRNQDGSDSYHDIRGGYAWHRIPEPKSPPEEEGIADRSGNAQDSGQPVGQSTPPDLVRFEGTDEDDTNSRFDAKPIKTEDDMKVQEQQIKLEVFGDDIKQEHPEPSVPFDIDSAVSPAADSNPSESGSGEDSGLKCNERHPACFSPIGFKSADPEMMRVARGIAKQRN